MIYLESIQLEQASDFISSSNALTCNEYIAMLLRDALHINNINKIKPNLSSYFLQHPIYLKMAASVL
jgi:hypothetical protein